MILITSLDNKIYTNLYDRNKNWGIRTGDSWSHGRHQSINSLVHFESPLVNDKITSKFSAKTTLLKYKALRVFTDFQYNKRHFRRPIQHPTIDYYIYYYHPTIDYLLLWLTWRWHPSPTIQLNKSNTKPTNQPQNNSLTVLPASSTLNLLAGLAGIVVLYKATQGMENDMTVNRYDALGPTITSTSVT